jgi:hypothetical protein
MQTKVPYTACCAVQFTVAGVTSSVLPLPDLSQCDVRDLGTRTSAPAITVTTDVRDLLSHINKQALLADADGNGIPDFLDKLIDQAVKLPILDCNATAGAMTQTAAQYKIIAVGLTLGTVTSQYSATVASGLVIEQDPAAGLAEASGTAVNLIVSAGSSTTSVPSVAGMSQTAAQDAITTAGLVLGNVSHAYSDSVEMGLVISQTPEAAATANAGDQVYIVVSDGPTPGGCNGCAGGTAKALGSGLAGGNGLLLSAVFTLLSPFRRP